MNRRTRPWSKLQKQLYNIITDKIDLQIHCVVYSMNSNYGNTGLPRYFITLDKEIIWDYPADFIKDKTLNKNTINYPYNSDVPEISNLIEEYVNTGSAELADKVFDNDRWGLTDILKSADRRMGRRRLEVLRHQVKNIAVKNIIEKILIN